MRTTGYIDATGKYVKGKDRPLTHDVNPLYKEYSHDMGRKEFAKEIIQPHKDGKPNPEFVRNYPDVSKEYWSQEQIDQAERNIS
jgi:hypothetical protein